MEKKIRVVLADDHQLVRQGICAALTDIEVVGEATNGNQVQQLCQELQPDVRS